jgi:uncharacterized protein (TIGR00255 family)
MGTAMFSMTGFGEARRENDRLAVRIEIRSVNNRHLKVSYRLPDGYLGFEPQLEAVIKDHIHRGSLLLNVSIDRVGSEQPYTINEALLVHYHEQISALRARLHDTGDIHLADLLQLPGVVIESLPDKVDSKAEWPLVEATLIAAIEQLNHMRKEEGNALAADLRLNCQAIGQELDEISQRAPEVVTAYQARLLERINQLLAEHNLQADPTLVVREVGLFADRVDIAEECVRLRSHLDQFERIMAAERHSGRKLDFLVQELLREANTIGSKANNAQIARHVVQIKTNIERLREMIQNVE